MLFSLVLVCFVLAIGVSEADESICEFKFKVKIGLVLEGFGLEFCISESVGSEEEEGTMFRLVFGNLGMAMDRSESEKSAASER